MDPLQFSLKNTTDDQLLAVFEALQKRRREANKDRLPTTALA
jgi:hypothetical protein